MIVSVDTGNKHIKTPHKLFSAGLVEHDAYPHFGQDVIFFEDKYYTVSNSRLPYQRDKTVNLNYFILTLFAIAYELQEAGYDLRDDVVEDVTLLVGLPPAHLSALRSAYRAYFREGEYVDFEFNNIPVTLQISKVKVYSQAMAAISPVINDVLQYPKVIIVDIGGYTADVLSLYYGKIDTKICYSLEHGTIPFYNLVHERVNANFDLLVDEQDVDAVLLGGKTVLPEEVADLICNMARQYINDFMSSLREMHIDLKTYMTYFVGGGSLLFKPFICESGKLGSYTVIEDINANAAGYELLYQLGL